MSSEVVLISLHGLGLEQRTRRRDMVVGADAMGDPALVEARASSDPRQWWRSYSKISDFELSFPLLRGFAFYAHILGLTLYH